MVDARYCSDIYILYDEDMAGIVGAESINDFSTHGDLNVIIKTGIFPKGEDLDSFIKKHSKLVSNDKFKKGDIVYLNVITTAVGKIFNGKKCEIVKKSDEKEDCYDLYDPSIKGKDGDSNVKGMPTKYIFGKKPAVVTEPEEKPKAKPRATKKAPRK